MFKQFKLIGIAYHRNGCHGNGFYAVTFQCRIEGQRRNMVAVAFTDDDQADGIQKGDIAILDADMAARGNVRAGHNSWRFEDFDRQIKDVIRAHRQQAEQNMALHEAFGSAADAA